jgi:hypothetical protein
MTPALWLTVIGTIVVTMRAVLVWTYSSTAGQEEDV